MNKKTKQYLIFVLFIIGFAFLSVINVYLMLKKENGDLILFYSIACFFFAFWLLDLIFSDKFFSFFYKTFQKPMSKSMTMDLMGASVVSEKKAYKTYKKLIKILPYICFSILIIGIILLLLQ